MNYFENLCASMENKTRINLRVSASSCNRQLSPLLGSAYFEVTRPEYVDFEKFKR